MRYSIIVAGGSGIRMGTDEPKQFLLLKGRPVLMHSIEKFAALCDETIVVLPEAWLDHWKKLCEKHAFLTKHTVVKGGVMRADSVKAGLAVLTGKGIVGIHDAVRPLVSLQLIEQLYKVAEEKGSAVPFLPVGESMRILEDKMNKSVDRSKYVLVQTPQCFLSEELKKAFDSLDFSDFTDEASLMEKAGLVINLVEGERTNIKITLPADLKFAESCIL